MKKQVIKLAKTTAVALVNVCFLCGAGYVIDWSVYLFNRCRKTVKKQWQSLLKIILNNERLINIKDSQ